MLTGHDLFGFGGVVELVPAAEGKTEDTITALAHFSLTVQTEKGEILHLVVLV